MIPNMITERWLVFKISKYGYETLWLVFKIEMLKTIMLKTRMNEKKPDSKTTIGFYSYERKKNPIQKENMGRTNTKKH